MLTRAIAQSLMGIVPEKVTASVALQSDNGAATTVSCPQCWVKPLKTSNTTYAGYALTGQETLINVPDGSLNPTANGRKINPGDEITIGSVVYLVQAASLKSVRTRWECLVTNKL